jgi:hypothetical protein
MIGQIIALYQVVKKLGGMGNVYQAEGKPAGCSL